MKLDRNLNRDKRGKYALLKLRRQDKPISKEAQAAADLLKKEGLLHMGNEDDTAQFFVIKYRDPFALPAMRAYTDAVEAHVRLTGDKEMEEYARDLSAELELIQELLNKGKTKLPT